MKSTFFRRNQCPRRRASDYDQDKLLSFTVGILLGWVAEPVCRAVMAALT